MNTSEKIASAIKSILDEDRRADRERIAELERNAAILKRNLSQACKSVDELNDLVVDLNKQLDELNEECATLAVERDGAEMRARVAGETVNSLMRRLSPMTDTQHETPAVKRTPQVGDNVKLTANSMYPGLKGVVLSDLGNGAMTIAIGKATHVCRWVKPCEIEVIE